MLQSGETKCAPPKVPLLYRTLLVSVAQEAGAAKVVVSGPKLLKVCPERVGAVIDIASLRGRWTDGFQKVTVGATIHRLLETRRGGDMNAAKSGEKY